MTTVEDMVEACHIARAKVEAEVLRVNREIRDLDYKYRCSWCCAPSGEPCHTRNGYQRMYRHVGRGRMETTEEERRRYDVLYHELHLLRQALRG